MSEINVTLGDQAYVSRPSAIGIDGYNLAANPAILPRFPMPGKVRVFFNNFCTARAISPSDIPLKVELPASDDEDMRPLVTGAVIKTLEEYGYNFKDTAGLSVRSPPGDRPLFARLKNDAIRIILEHYDEGTDTISVAHRMLYDDDLREQLNRRYNLPVDTSEDYLMVYLCAHSTVHRVQKMQGRLPKKPEGVDYDPEREMVESLKLESEKEAHNMGIRIADEIWKEVVPSESDSD